MKKFLFSIVFILISGLVFSQYPDYFNYQAIARNDDGSPLKNKQIAVEVSVLRGNDCINSGNCVLLWQELHFPTTNEFGLFSIEIGNGTNTYAGSVASFGDIDWQDFSYGNYYLKIRVDFGNSASGNTMQDLGIVKFLSVPYAMTTKDIARNSQGKLPFSLTELSDVNIDTSTLTTNQILSWNGSEWVNVTSTGGSVLALNDLTDVSLSSVTNGQVLYFDGNDWVNYGLNLGDLADVNVSPNTSQFLKWDGSQWISDSVAISDLKNVNLGTLNNGDVLTWQSGQWVNQPPSGGSSLWSQTGSNIYYNSGRVGIGTNSPSFLFHTDLGTDNLFVVSGTANLSAIAPSWSPGIYFSFNAGKVVFLGGEVSGTQWNSPGNYSFNYGKDNTASGVYSITFGQECTANGDYSFVGGLNSSTSGVRTFAYGEGLEAVSILSTVFGRYNYSTGQNPSTWYPSNQLFVLGNGTDASNRHNAFVVRKDGSAYIQDSLYQKSPNPTKSKEFNQEILPQILKLTPVMTFSGKGQGFGIDYYSMYKTFPNLTTQKFNGGETAINYIGLIPVLVKGIQEQQATINSLQKQVDLLNQRIEILEEKLNNGN